MKKLLLLSLFIVYAIASFATHIAGGELYYERIGSGGANSDKYKVTMRLFRQCNSTGGSGAALTIEAPNVGIYNSGSFAFVTNLQLTATFTTPPTISNNPSANPCLTGSTSEITSCYEVGTWTGEIELPRTANGYTLVWTRYTRRSAGVQNVAVSTETGATFTTQIPGTNVLANGYNSSPQFVIRDTALVCKETTFALDYSATDIDGDSLAYKFTAAYEGVNGSSSSPDPFSGNNFPSVLSISPLTYVSPYTSTSPLGSNVNLNVQTGVMSGVAPSTPGYYVICVVVEEWRDGVKINNHRKDFILKVGNCSAPKPDVGPDDRTCDGYVFNFSNQTTGTFSSYLWSFGDGQSSSSPTPTHTYTDTGKFLVKLKVSITGGCQDSSEKYIYVFPGFKSYIRTLGVCYQAPIKFYDSTKTVYGIVDSWKWDFGDLTTLADTARSKDTAWQYPSPGQYLVSLTSTNSKGCIDTTTKQITVIDKPIINLPFKDTLICTIDTLQLIANSTGSFNWTPNYNIIGANTSSPFVFPKDTTTYIVTVNDQGCVNTDSIKVNTLDFITVDAGIDTGICKTDTIRLRPISHALNYLWTASTGVPVQAIKYPLIQPLVTTKYYVTANLGKCQDRDSVTVRVAPYPQVSTDSLKVICFGDKVQLNANIVGSNFYWSPTNTLLNANTLNPIAGPSKTTRYILTVTDTIGCPKPVRDSVLVSVIPIVTVNAGKDTSVVLGQPLQLTVTTNATNMGSYLWTPNYALNNDTIFNPIALFTSPIDSIKYTVNITTKEGCKGSDEIIVRIFRTGPEIFVPSAFTPNGDGKNDIVRPICVGIAKLNYFRIYNRWGQLLYETKEFEQGWNGTYGGSKQDAGTYVYMAEGIDYTGKVHFKKGTVVLIR